jgi:hypothetical protein
VDTFLIRLTTRMGQAGIGEPRTHRCIDGRWEGKVAGRVTRSSLSSVDFKESDKGRVVPLTKRDRFALVSGRLSLRFGGCSGLARVDAARGMA